MFRSVTQRFGSAIVKVANRQLIGVASRQPIIPASCYMLRNSSTAVTLTDEQRDEAWMKYFDNPELDYFDFCLGFMDLFHEDAIPEPMIVQSILYACRRLDNLPLALRCMELVRIKCREKKEIYDYVIQELGPTFDALGLKTPEQLGIDIPTD